MDIFEAISDRHSVRKFKPDVPPLEDIKTIINAARLAPSASNAQMWHFIVIFNADIKSRMKQAIIDTYDEIMEWEEAKDKLEKVKFYKEYSTFFTDAPVNIAVLMEPRVSAMEEILIKRELPEREILRRRPNPGLLSIGAAIENISLSSQALGYGTCWLTAPIQAYKRLEEILHIKPPFELVSFLCLGKPLDESIPVKSRKDISEILTILK